MVLYEMATGQRAFTGDTAVAVQEAILTKRPPPVESLNPEIPGSLATVIRKALEKDRSQRYQTATAMRYDLERVRGTLVQSDRRRISGWVPAAAAVLAIAGAFAWSSARRSTGATLSADDTIVVAHLTNATGDRVFDEALYTALRIALEQTPYLIGVQGFASGDISTEDDHVRLCRFSALRREQKLPRSQYVHRRGPIGPSQEGHGSCRRSRKLVSTHS
jgi:eukaryotic-like serine/threonine-protein kinase